MLSERKNIEIKVFYSWGENSLKKYDPGFGRVIEWDIPLLEGYQYEFLENSSKKPGSHHYQGIINPYLKQQINTWNPDALLVIGWNYHSHLQALQFFHGRLPILFRGDSTLLDEQSGWRKIARRIALNWVYRHVDIALYAGSANKRYFEAHGLKEKQLVFAPHAVDNERFVDNEIRRYSERALAWRREIGFSDIDIVLLFAGKTEPVKNPLFLLKSIQLYNSFHPKKLKAIFVGNGSMENKLKKMAFSDANIRFLDFQNQTQMPVVYRLGDIFCLPSRSETWGLSVNEAMACGKSVLVSDHCGCAADLVKTGKNGFIFQSENHDDFAEKINSLCKQGTEGLVQLGAKSKTFIQSWSMECLTESITSTIQSF